MSHYSFCILLRLPLWLVSCLPFSSLLRSRSNLDHTLPSESYAPWGHFHSFSTKSALVEGLFRRHEVSQKIMKHCLFQPARQVELSGDPFFFSHFFGSMVDIFFPVKRRHPRYTKLFAAPQILYHVRKFRICPDLGSKRKASQQLSVPRTGCRAEIQK